MKLNEALHCSIVSGAKSESSEGRLVGLEHYSVYIDNYMQYVTISAVIFS